MTLHLPSQLLTLNRIRNEQLPHLDSLRHTGRIRKLVGLTLESHGPQASIGDLVQLRSLNESSNALAEVVGFRDNRVLLMPLDGLHGIRAGDEVYPLNEGFRIPIGPAMLGRILDGLARPIDDQPPPPAEAYWPVHRPAPNALQRRRVTDFFHTGVRSIDTSLTCGYGQRMGIFAGSGVGKSTLLGMICRHSSADINVIALIGERGKEVRDFIEDSLGPEGLAKSVVIVVTSDRPPLQRVRGAEVAMAIAEYFRDQQKNVLLVMDSVTRYAMAQREIGLAIGEPPTTKGYPPSVFGLLPALLERAGNNERGSITAFITVLVEGDDLNDPIADTVRGILDGHIVLSRKLANTGIYPPIDILASLSRVTNQVCTPEHLETARQIRNILATYAKSEDLINIGAYEHGSNPAVDEAIEKYPLLVELFRQRLEEFTPWPETMARVQAILSTQHNT